MAELIFSGVTKKFDDQTAVDDINISVASGEFVALLGPSGCGKTTLLRLTAGFEQPTEGQITFGGDIVAGPERFVPPEARAIGIVFQSYALWPHKSVSQNIAYPLEVRRIARPLREQRVAEALSLTGLEALGDRMPSQLSGGQRQRVALARCLVFDPRAVLLDEPLANLDLALRSSMHEVFSMFHQRTEATMVYVTHDQSEALALADRVAVMKEGRVRQFAPPEELYRRPVDCFVAGFVGDGAVVTVNAAGERQQDRIEVDILGQRVTASCATSRPTHASIRPEGITLDTDAPLRGRVISCTYLGGRFRLVLDIAGESLIAFARHRAIAGENIGIHLTDPWVFNDPTFASEPAPLPSFA